jgi:hypothetical protein
MKNIEVKQFTIKQRINKHDQLIYIEGNTINIEEVRFIDNDMEEEHIIRIIFRIFIGANILFE